MRKRKFNTLDRPKATQNGALPLRCWLPPHLMRYLKYHANGTTKGNVTKVLISLITQAKNNDQGYNNNEQSD